MAGEHNFEHLPLLLRLRGPARLGRPPGQSPQTRANRNARDAHSAALWRAAESFTEVWRERTTERQRQAQEQNLPVLPHGVPILLQVDPSLDLDVLRDKFSFEIVAEQEEGYVIVASEDLDLAPFVAMVKAFAVEVRGSAVIASVHRLFDDPDQLDRLRRILSVELFDEWPRLHDEQSYVVDVGIACTGTGQIPTPPAKRKRDTDSEWASKMLAWSQARSDVYASWDAVRLERENEISRIVGRYGAEILHLIDGVVPEAAFIPDSFTIRLRIAGRGLKDFVLNYPYIFEVLQPEEITLPQPEDQADRLPREMAEPLPPEADAPAVCVIDSGIQENHILIEAAIDRGVSRCFLKGRPPDQVEDSVRPGGHGTRVAGAVLFGESVAKNGRPQLPFWIQNARVMDENNCMPVEMPPSEVIRSVVGLYHRNPRRTRIFNHSINARTFCRTRYMSAWAAEIDSLCEALDVLIVQSAGNLVVLGRDGVIGITEHLRAGRDYPEYLYEPSTRIANPGQSLQALTVGSIAYGSRQLGDWNTFASHPGHPSAFSRCGPGIWDVIKPEVVEYGGDCIRTHNLPPDVQGGGQIPEVCPELVRSTMFPPGPAYDRDESGTSFATAKVTRIAAELQRVLPNESSLLYRALIVQSARWPEWAERILIELGTGVANVRREQLLAQTSNAIRCLGYGIPHEGRATRNTEYRTTLITSDEVEIHARECHIYQVPIPDLLRGPGDEFDIRIEVTLSYVAQPRRTRRNLRRYLSTWLDWKTSRLGEEIEDFRLRAMKEEAEIDAGEGTSLPWVLQQNSAAGLVRNTKRSNGTVQKDWATVKSNSLPKNFCIAVVGHQGWSRDPDSVARYALAVTLEIVGQEISIYDPIRTAVIALEAQLQVRDVPEIEI